MKTKVFVGLVLLLFGFTFLVAGGALAAKKARYRPPLVLPVDGAQPPAAYRVPSPVMYERAKVSDCTETFPEVPLVQGPDIWGITFYDYQKNGSMGRMIAVSSAGRRGMVFHETRGPYDPGPGQVYGRYVTYNCKDNDNTWGGPTYIHGGVQQNAGYANIMIMHDGREIVLDHRTAGTPMWYTCLIVSDEGFPCTGYFTNLYDLPDEHDFETGEGHGYWPKGCIVYDAVVDTDYIHIVTTEPVPSAGDPHTIAYQRCVFQGDALVCYSPGYGPYTRNPGIPHTLPSPIAVIDTTETISAVAVSSPVSEKVAIVYTKHRADASINQDVIYIESTNNGDDWLDLTQWPPTKHNVTNYDPLWTERAFTDVAACYDYNDNLHIVWNSCYYDSVTGDATFDANLMHWTDTDPLGFDNATMVAPGYWDDGTVNPGAWNRILSKMSVAAKDPIYHPGGTPDSVYLFCTWTQFNQGDNSAAGFTNGEIYAAVSTDGGQTWGRGYNLTNTQTPNCAPGECLSEHWSSLAENMYDGDLHIEYVCDRDAGGAIIDAGSGWTDNDMMYLHLSLLPGPPCGGISYSYVDPPSFATPPIKIRPTGSRTILLKVHGTYNYPADYEVTTDHPKVTCQANCSGYLSPGEEKYVELLINCASQEEFINATITIRWCIGEDDEDSVKLAVHAVCSDDYYECDRDSATFIGKDNNILKLWACVNTSQELWDQRIADEEMQKVIFSGGVIVATTAGEDTVVGRQDYKDVLTGARDTINVVQGYDYFEPECNIQKIHVKDTYIWTPHLEPPNDFKWWWIDIHKQIILFHDNPEVGECPEWKKEQVIKYVWIDWGVSPGWWPDPGVYEGHQDIYFGVFTDVDAPFDQGCNGCNTAGYDYAREMIWHHGWYNDTLPGGHPEYEDHYVGLALTDPSGAVVAPWGVQNVLNEEYLYPQQSWGWLDGELYQLAATPGVNVHHSDSVADRIVVLTADLIPAGTEDNFESEFILIEASVPTGLAQLQAHMDTTREVLIPELDWLGLFEKRFPVCGDCNEDEIANIADVIFLKSYLFIYGRPPRWPMNRGDVNNDGAVNVADMVGLINYLFLPSHPALDCSGFGRE